MLVVEPAGNLWGSERVLLDFLHCAARSIDIGVCFPRATPIEAELASLPVSRYPWFIADLHKKTRVSRALGAAGLILAALRFRPNIIYVNQAGATRIAMLAARLLSVPILAHVRLADDVDYIARLVTSHGFDGCVVAVSDYVRDRFRESGAIPEDRLHRLYDPYRSRDGAARPHEAGRGPAAPHFASVGRIARLKGQDVLLDAIAVLKSENIEATVAFAGSAPDGDDFATHLQRHAVRLAIAEQVRWGGYQADVFAFAAGALAWICPSWQESLGRVIFESLEAGCLPIAWSGSGGPAEVIRASGGGLLYEQQTGASLAQAMKQAMALSPHEYAQRVERGRAWVVTNCAPPVFSRRMLEISQAMVCPV